MICPILKRIEKSENILLDRFYPGKGKPVVKAVQNVVDTDIIAHCEISAGQRLIKIAHTLGVTGREVGKYLTRKIGDRVYEGEIIARKKGLFAVGKREIKSPIDGLISEIDERGDIILKFLPKPVRLISGASGIVREITESKITIATSALKINGFVSEGKMREGIIEIISAPKEYVFPNMIKPDSRGKILVGGSLLEKSSLEKAVTLGVAGIITGGINFKEFDDISKGGDIGITVLVTEGFGTNPMGKDIWDLVNGKKGRLGFISGESNCLIIPEKFEEQGRHPSSNVDWKELRIGDKVRFLRPESSETLGEVKELPGMQIINSGILAEIALVAFASGEELLIPSANLEILE